MLLHGKVCWTPCSLCLNFRTLLSNKVSWVYLGCLMFTLLTSDTKEKITFSDKWKQMSHVLHVQRYFNCCWSPVGLTVLSQNFVGLMHQNGAFLEIKLTFFSYRLKWKDKDSAGQLFSYVLLCPWSDIIIQLKSCSLFCCEAKHHLLLFLYWLHHNWPDHSASSASLPPLSRSSLVLCSSSPPSDNVSWGFLLCSMAS